MPAMSESRIDEFLRETRIGVLCTNDLDGSPNGVPVWFEWDGERIRMFSHASHKKIARLEHDPRASLLVAREVGEAGGMGRGRRCCVGFRGRGRAAHGTAGRALLGR